jgi:ribonuclease P/MRP protein subunit RPP1
MIKKSSELGYQLVGIPLPYSANRDLINQIKKICNNYGLDTAIRVNLSPSNSNDLLKDLRKVRRKFEIVGIRCATKDIARQAAKDRRVDLLQFSLTNLRKRFFDKQEAQLSSQALSSLEIELAPILQLTSFSRIRLLSILRKEVDIAKKANVPIIFSSGASDENFMRNPYDYSALAILFDLDLGSALKSFSDNALQIIKRNREKLDPNYIAPGIRIIRRNFDD